MQIVSPAVRNSAESLRFNKMDHTVSSVVIPTAGTFADDTKTEMQRHILKKLSDLEARVAQTENNQRLQDEMIRLRRQERDQAV
jgi:hypothetical protein